MFVYCFQSEDGRSTYSMIGLTAGAYSEAEKKKKKFVKFSFNISTPAFYWSICVFSF